MFFKFKFWSLVEKRPLSHFSCHFILLMNKIFCSAQILQLPSAQSLKGSISLFYNVLRHFKIGPILTKMYQEHHYIHFICVSYNLWAKKLQCLSLSFFLLFHWGGIKVNKGRNALAYQRCRLFVKTNFSVASWRQSDEMKQGNDVIKLFTVVIYECS